MFNLYMSSKLSKVGYCEVSRKKTPFTLYQTGKAKMHSKPLTREFESTSIVLNGQTCAKGVVRRVKLL